MTVEPKLMSPDELAEIGRLAPQVVTQLDGRHGDPSKWGNWIGHRNYAQWCVRLLAHVTELATLLAASRDINRHYEQERDSWGAAYKQRAAKTDARIKELEAGLREAMSLVRHEPTWLSEDEVAVAARLQTLIPSEDK